MELPFFSNPVTYTCVKMEQAEVSNMYENPCYAVSGTRSTVATKEAKMDIEKEAKLKPAKERETEFC